MTVLVGAAALLGTGCATTPTSEQSVYVDPERSPVYLRVIDENGAPYERCTVGLEGRQDGVVVDWDWGLPEVSNAPGAFVASSLCLSDATYSIAIRCTGSRESAAAISSECPRGSEAGRDGD